MSETPKQYIDMEELAGYEVAWSDDPARGGWHIISRSGGHSVWGMGTVDMDEVKSKRFKAFCEYWCFHLNLAYALGWVNRDGNTISMTPKMKARFDELYEGAFGS